MGRNQNQVIYGSDGSLLAASKEHWTKEAVSKVDNCFAQLKQARVDWRKVSTEDTEIEALFQAVGLGLLQLTKNIKKFKNGK